jgi:hypothetical protein
MKSLAAKAVAPVAIATVAVLMLNAHASQLQQKTSMMSSAAAPTAFAQLEEQNRWLMAQHDLASLSTVLSFHPWLPDSLPAGYSYYQVVWPPTTSGKSDGFGLYIVGPDSSAGTRAIHIHEGRGTPSAGNKEDPILAFRGFTHAKSLRSGVWQVMQQQHQPWQGEWIYMVWKGDVFIEVDGLAPQPVLESVVASLR